MLKKNVEMSWKLLYNFEEVAKNSTIARTIIFGPKSGTITSYQNALDEIVKAAEEAGVELKPGQEKAFVCDELHRLVTAEKVSPENKAHWRSALGKLHAAHEIDNSWVHTNSHSSFWQGLRSMRAEQVANGEVPVKPPRLVITYDLLMDMVASADKLQRHDLALGLQMLFFSLYRHGHMSTILKCDLNMLENGEDVLVYLWNFKQNSSVFEGDWVLVPNVQQRLKTYTQGMSSHHQVFKNWSEDDAVKFVQEYCNHRQLGWFKVDIHCLRGSGLHYFRSLGVPMNEVKFKGRWSPTSMRFMSYSAIYDPITAKVLEDCLLNTKEKEFVGPKMRHKQRKKSMLVQMVLSQRIEVVKALYGRSISEQSMLATVTVLEGGKIEGRLESNVVDPLTDGDDDDDEDDFDDKIIAKMMRKEVAIATIVESKNCVVCQERVYAMTRCDRCQGLVHIIDCAKGRVCLVCKQ